MATLYWGGGTGTWDGFTTANWYTNVGRTTLSTRAPSAEDDVVFDSASNATAYTVTVNDNAVCRNVTIAGPASGNLTLAGSGTWFIYGNFTLPATGFTRTYTGSIQFYGAGSHTITTNGVSLASGIFFQGTGTYTLQDALNNGSSTLFLNAGTFNTNNRNLTCGSIGATLGTTAGTLTLGSSTVSATTIGANAPITINAGTSNITLSSNGIGIGSGTNYTGNTFNNVTFSATDLGTINFYGNNTFNNLTFAAKSTATISAITLFGNLTVTGTLTIAGQLSVRRYFVRSSTIGTPRTLTVGTVASLVDVDFRDITVAGTSSPWSGTRLGNCGGNTNITFPSPKTVYWNGTTGGAWTGNFWATSSGGAVNAANFPLAQDTAIINDTGLSTATLITGFSSYNLGTLTSTKTNAYSLEGSDPNLYGNLTLTASTTVSGFSPIFAGRVTQDLTSAGNTIAGINCSGFGASVRLLDNTSTSEWTITSGGFNTNNRSFSASAPTFTNTGLPFTLTLGSSSVSILAFGNNSLMSPVMTVSAGTSTITITSSSGNIGFVGQTISWNNVVFSASPSSLQFYGTNTFNNLTLTGASSTGINGMTLGGNLTVTGTLALGGGASATQRFSVVSDTPGTQRTITAAAVTGLSDTDFRDIAAAGASAPWSGTRLGNCQGNSGITFPSAKTVYWNLAGTQSWSATAWATTSGGTPAVNNFPLAQDTCVFDNTGSAGNVVLNSAWNIGTINMSGRTSAMTLSGSPSVSIYGDVTYGSGITSTASGTWIFRNTSTQTFTTAGKTLANTITINNPSCLFQHGDAYTSPLPVNITSGSYNTQNYNISCSQLSSSNTNTRSITLGTSTLTFSAQVVVTLGVSTGLTFSGASSTINMSQTAAKTFQGGGQTFGTVSSTGGTTNPLTISGSNTFSTLTNSARTYLIFASGTTQTVTNFTYTGDVSNVVRWYTNIPGQRATLRGNSAAVGANSVDGGNNSGLSFTGASPNYFYVKDIAYSPNVIPSTFFMLF